MRRQVKKHVRAAIRRVMQGQEVALDIEAAAFASAEAGLEFAWREHQYDSNEFAAWADRTHPVDRLLGPKAFWE